MGRVINGTNYGAFSGMSNISLNWSTQMTIKCGVDNNVRQIQVFSGTKKVIDAPESGTLSRLCNLGHTTPAAHTDACIKYRGWGSIMEYDTGVTSGTITSVSVTDGGTPLYRGSVARMSRVSNDVVQAITTTDTAITGGFFDTSEFESLDIDATLTDGTFTVTKEGMYAITARIKLNDEMDANVSLGLQVLQSGSWKTMQRGPTLWAADTGAGAKNPSSGFALTGNWLQYIRAGEKVRLSVQADRSYDAGISKLTGAPYSLADLTFSPETYFAISAV